VNRKLFLGNRFIAVKIVQLDFGSGREPEVGVLYFKEIGGEFGQLAAPMSDAVLTGMVEESPSSRAHAYERRGKNWQERARAGAPAFVNGETRAGDLCGGRQIQDACAFATSQWGFGGKSNFGGAPQRRTSTLSAALAPTGTDECGTLGIVRSRPRWLASSSATRSSDFLMSSESCFIPQLAHRRSVLSFLSRAISSLAFCVCALRCSLRDQLAALFVERAKRVQIERDNRVSSPCLRRCPGGPGSN